MSKLDDATRAACEMGRFLQKHGYLDAMSKPTRRWFKIHDAEDRIRLKKELKEARQKKVYDDLMGKLSSEQKEALSRYYSTPDEYDDEDEE